MRNLGNVVEVLKKEQSRLATQLNAITSALAAFGESYIKGRGTRKMSDAGRARIAAAQRARWAKIRNGKVEKTQSKVVTMPKPRTLSPAARKRIAAAQRARWAKVRAAKKRA